MKSFQRALGFLRPYWLITLGAFVSLILMTGANLVSPRILSDIIDRGISTNDTQHLLWASLLLVGKSSCWHRTRQPTKNQSKITAWIE